MSEQQPGIGPQEVDNGELSQQVIAIATRIMEDVVLASGLDASNFLRDNTGVEMGDIGGRLTIVVAIPQDDGDIEIIIVKNVSATANHVMQGVTITANKAIDLYRDNKAALARALILRDCSDPNADLTKTHRADWHIDKRGDSPDRVTLSASGDDLLVALKLNKKIALLLEQSANLHVLEVSSKPSNLRPQ